MQNADLTVLLVCETMNLPLLNACLNATAAALLVVGYVQIRRGHRDGHRALMIGAFVASVLFLLSYVAYHASAGSRPYQGRGAVRVLYFAILISHVVLAALVPPLAIVTLMRAWKGRFAAHRALARWTLPVWLYVSITGVLVYVMLY